MQKKVALDSVVEADMTDLRFDQALAQLFPDYSRARLSAWIKSGEARLNGESKRPRDRVVSGDKVSIDAILQDAVPVSVAEAIDLDIIYEDDFILVVNKPLNLVVHPGAGNTSGTLMNALLHHCPSLSALPRAGIVHRLDKNTTGLMVVAKTLTAHHSLIEAMQQRHINREYETIVHGVMTAGGRIDEPIGRHPVDRKRMAVVASGKPAVTHNRVLERFRLHTWVRVKLETGRTHQIRVHLAHRRYPIVGDPVYGGRMRQPANASESLLTLLQGFKHQALHAIQLALPHPESGETLQWQAPLPVDMQNLLNALRQDKQAHQE